jgi:nicotinamidase-related amidase
MEHSHNQSKQNGGILHSLIDLNSSCLVAVDVQTCFTNKLSNAVANDMTRRITWLADIALHLGVPMVITAEDIDKNGSILPELKRITTDKIQIHNKMVFNLAADSIILDSIKATNRETIILIGLETDVCVAQSALGLIQNGYNIVVVEDACGSPGLGHERGIKRMKGAGALISNTKALYYEWLRDIKHCRSFYQENENLMLDFEPEL